MLRFITLQREPPSSVVSFGMGSGQAWEVQWFLSLTCCTIVQDMSQDWIDQQKSTSQIPRNGYHTAKCFQNRQTPHLCKRCLPNAGTSETENESRKQSLAVFTVEDEPKQLAASRCRRQSIWWKIRGQDSHIPSKL